MNEIQQRLEETGKTCTEIVKKMSAAELVLMKNIVEIREMQLLILNNLDKKEK